MQNQGMRPRLPETRHALPTALLAAAPRLAATLQAMRAEGWLAPTSDKAASAH